MAEMTITVRVPRWRVAVATAMYPLLAPFSEARAFSVLSRWIARGVRVVR